MRRTSKSWQDYQPKGALESAEEAPAPVVEVEIAAASPTAADAGSSKPGGPAVAAAEATAATKASNLSREAGHNYPHDPIRRPRQDQPNPNRTKPGPTSKVLG